MPKLKTMKLSVIIPAYNEERSIKEIINRVLQANLEKEIIVIDDGSRDKTKNILDSKFGRHKNIKILHHKENKGKGAAIQSGLKYVTGDIVITQDADLEYDPKQYQKLIKPILENKARVVYGSRNLGKNPRSYSRYYWGGKLLSWLTNLLYGSHITDESTGYKVFKTEILKNLSLKEQGFGFCPEVTAKILKKGYKILEVSISYQPRSFREGKKISWKDGLLAIFLLIKYRFID